MSSVSSPLGTFFPQAFNQPAAGQNSCSQRLQTAAQQTTAPVDTVTLSGYFGQISQSTLTAQTNQSATTTPAGQAAAAQANAAEAQAPAAGPALDAGSAPSATALPAVAQTLPNLVGASQATQQQELAQLDQLLQQLGVDPNSIPLSEQLNMVLYLNDPAALDQLVQSLGKVVQAPAQNSAGNSGQAAATIQAAPSANTATTPNLSASQVSGFAAQFQEFQQSLQTIGGSIAVPTNQSQARAATAAIGASGNSLNIVA